MTNLRKLMELKPLFIERMQKLLLDKKDFENFLETIKNPPVNAIRCNTLKISVDELKIRLKNRGWKISQPWKSNPEIIIIENDLQPGELGRAEEHLLGYYYVQEIVSMLPIIALKPQQEELILDLCAAPGSKTTQIASEMKNTGTIIANELSMPRLKILAANLERCGATNVIITRKEGEAFCQRLQKYNSEMKFDKILLDAPCSGEGTLRSSLRTAEMWNIKTIQNIPKLQKNLFRAVFEVLKIGGEMIYSTCTHAPEEDEAIVNWALEEFKEKIEIEKIFLPKELKFREGIIEWQGKTYNPKVKLSCRIYPQDNNTEGFFISKFRRVK